MMEISRKAPPVPLGIAEVVPCDGFSKTKFRLLFCCTSTMLWSRDKPSHISLGWDGFRQLTALIGLIAQQAVLSEECPKVGFF